MNNYNNFISELDTLVITTRERFVTRDGKILYWEDPYLQDNPIHYPIETDAEKHPDCHRVIFLNLDRYSQHERANPYTDSLRELRGKAIGDMFLLSNEQIRRVIVDAEKKQKRLSNLHKTAIEFKDRFFAGTLDDPIFLKVQLLDCFNTPNCPAASPDRFFARYLKDAIFCKLGELTAFIKQLKAQVEDEAPTTAGTQQATDTPPAADTRQNTFNPPMPLNEVEQWFMQLAESKSSNNKPFLTVEQVKLFIERAFVDNTDIPKLTFNIDGGERTSITKLFHLFYLRCTNDYAIEPTKHCKEKYVRLLTDNFTNYNYQTVFKTFNNSKKAIKEWVITI